MIYLDQIDNRMTATSPSRHMGQEKEEWVDDGSLI